MKEKLYVFGFDNTLVNTEDLIVDMTNQVLGIDMSYDFWYAYLHSVPSVEAEMRILEESFNVKYTPELQQKSGELFMQALAGKAPNDAVYKLVKEHMDICHFLTGSPLMIMQLYFPAWDIEISEDRIHAGVYNASGDKEKILAELQKSYDVVYIDDDAQLIRNASEIVSEAYLVKQPYITMTHGMNCRQSDKQRVSLPLKAAGSGDWRR